MDSVRIDKYLWSIRAFKTRSDATQACRGGKVRVNGADAKPSKEVKVGDVLTVRKGPATFTYKVNELVAKRQGAKNVSAFAENLTPDAEVAKLSRPVETVVFRRDPGTGRPTKKDRRQLEALVADAAELTLDASEEESDTPEIWSEEEDKRLERKTREAEAPKGFDMWAEESEQDAWLEDLDKELEDYDEWSID